MSNAYLIMGEEDDHFQIEMASNFKSFEKGDYKNKVQILGYDEAASEVAGWGKMNLSLLIHVDFRYLSLLCNLILNSCDAHQRVPFLGDSVFNHVPRVHMSTGEARL
jgi:hypothetical protein